jgi:hypothetical protein
MSWYGYRSYGGPSASVAGWHGGYYPSYFPYSNWSSYGGSYGHARHGNWGDWGVGSRISPAVGRSRWAYDRVLDGYLWRY